MDETGDFACKLPQSTLSHRQKICRGWKHYKDQVTMVFKCPAYDSALSHWMIKESLVILTCGYQKVQCVLYACFWSVDDSASPRSNFLRSANLLDYIIRGKQAKRKRRWPIWYIESKFRGSDIRR